MKKVLIIIKTIRKKILLFINKIGSKKRHKKLMNNNFTIISNNCFAGVTYEYLNMPYLSPTIGLYFFADEYIRFVNNIKHYTSEKLEKLDINDSKYKKELLRINQNKVVLGKICDVEIVFLHYDSFDEAKEKWEKRCKRINYQNIIYKFNDQNLCNEKHLNEFYNLDFKNKICFTAKKYSYPNFYQLKRNKKNNCVKDDVFKYHKKFDIVKFINDNCN